MKSKIWAAVGLVTLLVLAYMLYPFRDIAIYSIFVYYIARPLHYRFLSKVRIGWVSAVASILTLALPVVVIVLYTIGVASIELNNFMKTTDVPALSSWSGVINESGRLAGEIDVGGVAGIFSKKDVNATTVVEALSGGLSAMLWDVFSRALSIVFKLFLVFVLSYYLILDGSKLRKAFSGILFPRDDNIDRFFDEVDAELSSVFYGNILTAGVIAVLGALVFNAANYLSTSINIPYPVLMGMLCGLTSLIPVAGVALIWAPLTAYLIINAAAAGMIGESAIPIALFFTATYVIVDWIPNIMLRPRMTGKKTHKGILLLSYIFGPIVFGLKGFFLGPMIVVFALNYAEFILPKLIR
jgi:predicted PurR-regulated permease PerM